MLVLLVLLLSLPFGCNDKKRQENGAGKENHIRSLEAGLVELEEKMESLKIRAEAAGKEAKAEFRHRKLHFDKKRAFFKAMLFRVKSAGTEDREEIQARLEGGFNKVKEAYEAMVLPFQKIE